MKLFRFGAPGAERAGLVDAAGVWRDVSGVVPDITPATLASGPLSRLITDCP